MELAQGQVADRPWGLTLGTLGVRALTGQLTLRAADGKTFCVAFARGAVVGATSPLPNDSATRVAVTSSLITSSQVGHVARMVAAHPTEDELDVVARACALTPDRVARLRQRVIAQRAARTFAVEAGSFVVEDTVTIPTSVESAVDLRAVVYLGIRTNVSEQRLTGDLRQLGTRFVLRPEAAADLPQFGLTDDEQPIVDALRTGTTLAELEARQRELDPRTVHAVIYALVVCSACEASLPVLAPPIAPLPRRNATNVDGVFIKPALRPAGDPAAITRAARGTEPPPTAIPPRASGDERGVARTTTPTRPLVAPRTTTPPEASGSGSHRAIDPLAEATEAFRRGQAALEREEIAVAIAELTTAAALNPHEFEFHATLAWAQFCGAPDKPRHADKVRKMLGHAIQKSLRPEMPRFYLGRMERMLGRDREALDHFQQVLALQPQHVEAATEIRTIEARLAAGSAEKPGLATLFSRKKP